MSPSLATPWPALAAFAASLDLSALDDVTHRHVPAAVLVIRACEAVRADKAAAAAAAGSQQATPAVPAPLSAADLPAVRAVLASWRRPAGHGGAALHADEENFDEAADFARRALAPPDAIRELQKEAERGGGGRARNAPRLLNPSPDPLSPPPPPPPPPVPLSPPPPL